MTKPSSFDYDRFLSLSGSDLIRYVEPFVTNQVDSVPESAYNPLSSSLVDLDEVHTVYALDICSLLKPSEFASRAVEFLSHNSSSVCCAACRALEKLPSNSMSDELVEKIAATPIVDLYTSHVRTGERIRIGTNEEFIRGLLARFAKS